MHALHSRVGYGLMLARSFYAVARFAAAARTPEQCLGVSGNSPLIRGSPTNDTRARTSLPPSHLLPFNLYLSYEVSLRPSFRSVLPLFCPLSDFLDPSGERAGESRPPKIHQSSLGRSVGPQHSLITIKRGGDSNEPLLGFRINVEGTLQRRRGFEILFSCFLT